MQREIVLVTGAASGIGRLAARNAAQAGAKVAALDVDEEGLAETTSGVDGITVMTVDVTDGAAVEDAVARTTRELGAIDRVYNAAAIMLLGRLVDQDAAAIHRMMQVNYGGLVNVTKATLPAMLERDRGDMILFASMAGWLPSFYVGGYNASKFAVVAFSEVLYHEHRDSGVRFCCVCPPPVATPLLDRERQSVWPKSFDEVPPLEPQEVLTAIEAALGAGDFWVFPGKQTKLSWRLRRWLPNVLWKRMHQIEGV